MLTRACVHAQGDVTGLKADVNRGLGTVSAAASAAAGNVALIVELERVKNRMEAACSTLKVHSLMHISAHAQYCTFELIAGGGAP